MPVYSCRIFLFPVKYAFTVALFLAVTGILMLCLAAGAKIEEAFTGLFEGQPAQAGVTIADDIQRPDVTEGPVIQLIESK